MNRSESKFNNTSAKMHRALLTLLEKREFSEISIMDICKIAGINRSTFYAHYDNTYDLLQEAHSGLIANFFNECSFDNHVDISDVRSLSKDDLNFITPKYLLPYLEYIKKHRRLFKMYANNAHTFETDRMDEALTEKLFIPILAKHGITDKRLITYMQKYFIKGIDAIVHEWLNRDCEDDVLFICEVITFCVRPTANK